MNYEKPNLKKPETVAETELRRMVNTWGIDLYEDVPEGWEVVEEFVAPYYLNPQNDEDGNLGESFNDLYGKGFWAVMPSQDMEGNPKYHLLDVIARQSDDELADEDEFTQAVDLGRTQETSKGSDPEIDEKDILRRMQVGDKVFTLVRGGKYDENA